MTYTGDEAGTITDGTDTIAFSETESLTLTDNADVLDASSDSAGTSVAAGAGDDTLTGGTGADNIDGGTGSDLGSAGRVLRRHDADRPVPGDAVRAADAAAGCGGGDLWADWRADVAAVFARAHLRGRRPQRPLAPEPTQP